MFALNWQKLFSIFLLIELLATFPMVFCAPSQTFNDALQPLSQIGNGNGNGFVQQPAAMTPIER
jgi:hypothetical protein